MNARAQSCLVLLALTIVLTSCGGSGGGSTPAPTASLTATPATITLGQNTALTYSSTNANQGSVDNGVGAVGLNGSIHLAPTTTTTYTYTVTGPGGSATASATVTVTPPPPPTATLTVAPSVTLPGQPVTVTWASTNATAGDIEPDFGSLGPNGVAQRFPTATTTYTFTATGPGGTATATATATVNPVTSFDGLKQSDGVATLDVDPNGAVGTTQFMEYVNTAFQAYDKVTGQPMWPSPQQIETLWSSTTECNPPTKSPVIQLDVQIIFDRLASRWVVGARTSDPVRGYYLCLAVSDSETLSPQTVWTQVISAKLDSTLGSNGTHTYFPDWPKFSTWTDASGQQSAYYATIDLLDIDNANAEVGAVVCAFDRAFILNHSGIVNPKMACVNVSDIDPNMKSNGLFLAHSLIPADIDGTTVPPAGRDQFMLSIQNPINDNVTLTSDTVNLWDFHVDWNATPDPTLSVSVAPLTVPVYTPGCYLYDPNNPAITNCVQEPQNNGQQLIDSVGDRMMPRLAYRNFGSYESFLISHTVQTGPGSAGSGAGAYQTGVRWYELRGSGAPAVYQSGTINPSGSVLSRFLPSIAQDKMGNAAVGYSISNGLNNPGIYFSFWNLPGAIDPIEIGIIDGPGEEVSDGNGVGQWGTYSSMTVDPTDGCTFWYVNEYFAADNTWLTRMANFQIPGCQ